MTSGARNAGNAGKRENDHNVQMKQIHLLMPESTHGGLVGETIYKRT